jgi:hypothetical protein
MSSVASSACSAFDEDDERDAGQALVHAARALGHVLNALHISLPPLPASPNYANPDAVMMAEMDGLDDDDDISTTLANVDGWWVVDPLASHCVFQNVYIDFFSLKIGFRLMFATKMQYIPSCSTYQSLNI